MIVPRIYRVSEVKTKALAGLKSKDLYVKGDSCGFKTGDEYVSYRKGYSTGIFSYSAQGKTQFYIQEAIHLSKQYGRKHAVWLTENGKKEELIIDLAMTYMGKSVFSPKVDYTLEELEDAFTWLDNHFYIIDHEESILNIRDIYEQVICIENTYNVKIDYVCIDNATNLAREAEKSRVMIHEYMNYLMTAINRTSLKKGYHTFILFHVGKTDFVECKTTKAKFQPPPSHFDIVGGQMVNYLGYQLIGVYRPISRQEQVGIINPETTQPFELNETQIIVTKSKPKAVGKQGKFTLYFDEDRQGYYEYVSNKRYYCGEYDNPKPKVEHSVLQPNYNFDNDIKF
jgi:hypothetical protein